MFVNTLWGEGVAEEVDNRRKPKQTHACWFSLTSCWQQEVELKRLALIRQQKGEKETATKSYNKPKKRRNLVPMIKQQTTLEAKQDAGRHQNKQHFLFLWVSGGSNAAKIASSNTFFSPRYRVRRDKERHTTQALERMWLADGEAAHVSGRML